jgi:HSP20 family protein
MRHLAGQDRGMVMPRLQDEINRLFGNAQESESSSATAAWIPLVDVHEFADRFELYVDIPGVDPGAVELTLDKGVLTVSGHRSEQQVSKTNGEIQAVRIERGHGSFHRHFLLPDTADGEKVKATGKNGVLTISISKQEKAKPRRIQISV